MTNFADILSVKYPELRWHLKDVTNYSSIEWKSEGPYPSEEDLLASSEEVSLHISRREMVVTPRQFRLALHQTDLLDTCEQLVLAANDPIVEINWNWAVSIERLSPFITLFAKQLNISEEKVDYVFELAASL